jgi:hypothetical protein
MNVWILISYLCYVYLFTGVIIGNSFKPILIFNIFLGDFNETTMSLMNFFGAYINTSPWFNTLTSYYNWGNGPTYVTNKMQLGGNLTLSTSYILQTLGASNLSRFFIYFLKLYVCMYVCLYEYIYFE